jgi:YHS domain-containing protein
MEEASVWVECERHTYQFCSSACMRAFGLDDRVTA